MRNDNKLGKEKQENKQIVSSRSFLTFSLSPFFSLRQSVMSHCMRTNGKGQWQKENHFNIVELAHDHYFYKKALLQNCSD